MTEKPPSQHRSRVRPALGILFALISLGTGYGLVSTFIVREAFFTGDQAGVYWLIGIDWSPFALGMTCIISAWIAFALLIPMQWLERLLITVIALFLIIGVLTLLGPQISEYYVHTDSIRTTEGIYHTGHVVMWAGSCPAIHTGRDACIDAYRYIPVVFRCDTFGLVCRAMYHASEQIVSGGLENHPTSTLTLTNNGTIHLLIDGDVIWQQSTAQGDD
jgi:hypothetical protein